MLNLGGVQADSQRVKPRLRTERIYSSTLTARRRRAVIASMLNAYYDLERGAWIACAIVDGEWIEGGCFRTWREADQASQFLIAARAVGRSWLPGLGSNQRHSD